MQTSPVRLFLKITRAAMFMVLVSAWAGLLTSLAVFVLSAVALAKEPAKKGQQTQIIINKIPAKKLFGLVKNGAPMRPAIYGGYTRGCYAGGVALPPNGEAWQAMRLHRNRNWGHPVMIEYIKRLAIEAKKAGEWNGLLVGDLAQPRGGPMLTGHRSHQLGIDADIWLREMPEPRFTLKQQFGNQISAISVIGSRKELGYDKYEVDPKVWRDAHYKLIKRAASYRNVARIFLHPAIKKKLCEMAPKNDRAWLRKIRPWWGHHYHMHVRLNCPPGNPGCKNQAPVAAGDGCGKPVEAWLKVMRKRAAPRKVIAKPKTKRKRRKWRPRPPVTLAGLPGPCRKILMSGDGAEQIAKKYPFAKPTKAVAKPVKLRGSLAVSAQRKAQLARLAPPSADQNAKEKQAAPQSRRGKMKIKRPRNARKVKKMQRRAAKAKTKKLAVKQQPVQQNKRTIKTAPKPDLFDQVFN